MSRCSGTGSVSGEERANSSSSWSSELLRTEEDAGDDGAYVSAIGRVAIAERAQEQTRKGVRQPSTTRICSSSSSTSSFSTFMSGSKEGKADMFASPMEVPW
jgi:hypothetical protein